MAHNYALWGTLLESPMVGQRSLFSLPIHIGLAGYLLSPGGSVFVYSGLTGAILHRWNGTHSSKMACLESLVTNHR